MAFHNYVPLYNLFNPCHTEYVFSIPLFPNSYPFDLQHSSCKHLFLIKNSEFDQEIPQSQTADNPVAP